jgi:hypothetical protein
MRRSRWSAEFCRTRDTVDQSEVEADVYILAGCILRFCSRCGTSTEWRRTSGDATIPSAARGTATKALSRKDQRRRKEPSSASRPEPVQTPCAVYPTEPPELVEIRAGRASAFQLKPRRQKFWRNRRFLRPQHLSWRVNRIAGATFAPVSVLPRVFARRPVRKSSSATTSPEAVCHFAVASHTRLVRCSRLLFLIRQDRLPSLCPRPSDMSKASMSAHSSVYGAAYARKGFVDSPPFEG